MIDKEFLTIKDVAKLLNISVSCLDKMQKDGTFPIADYKISKMGKRLWKHETILQWLDDECSNKKESA